MKRTWTRKIPLGPSVMVIVAFWMIGTDSSEIDAPTAPDHERAQSNEGPTLSLTNNQPPNRGASIRAIAERPLFAPGRRPPEPSPSIEVAESAPEADNPLLAVEPKPAAKPEPLQPPSIKLLGQMHVGEMSEALLRDERDGREVWVRLGEQVQGWTLVGITQSHIRIRAGDVEMTVQLFE